MPDDQNPTSQAQVQPQSEQQVPVEQEQVAQPQISEDEQVQAEQQSSEAPLKMSIGPTTEHTLSLDEQLDQAATKEGTGEGEVVLHPFDDSGQAPNQEPSSELKITPQIDPSSPKAKITLDQLIDLCIQKEASDIHFGEDAKVALRIGGRLVFIENIDSLSKENAEEMIFSMIPGKEEKMRFEHLREMDFSYAHSSGVNFRVNAFHQRGRLSAVMRMVSKHLPALDDLGVPEILKKKLALRKGLIIVAGVSGSGKSTTVQSMLEYINNNFIEHIITIENPIEYVFTNKRSIFSQREIGKDTLSASNALHAAVKEDPNVIMVSEIDDFETLNSVLLAVEAGYFVIAAMSTKNVRQTLERMFFMYHQSDQKRAQERIAENLIAILSQDLVNRTDRQGRIAVFELMLGNSGIRTIIKSGSLAQLPTAMQSGTKEGMVTMDSYAYHLGQQGIITQDIVDQFVEQD